MNSRIQSIVRVLKRQGDYGTANAIVDAQEIALRARRMLSQLKSEKRHGLNYDDEEILQARIDTLRELIYDTD